MKTVWRKFVPLQLSECCLRDSQNGCRWTAMAPGRTLGRGWAGEELEFITWPRAQLVDVSDVPLLLPIYQQFLSVFQFSSVQSLSRVRLFETPWIAARQASLSITNSRSLLKLMPIESVMPSSHLILCHPLLLPPIPPSIRVFSKE